MESSAARSPALVRSLQERAAGALPAEYVERLGDWWLRRSATSSWWMGTVLPHGEVSGDELIRLIAAAERFYAGCDRPARFQVCPGACAADLDATLAERGYRRGDPMSLRVASTVEVRALARPAALRIQLDEEPSTAWFEVWYAVHGDGNDPGIEWDMLDRVGLPSAYASVLAGDEVVAVGRTVVETAWAGVFGMATLPSARGRGAGRAVLAGLADWAASRDATGMYLQVERDNDAALRLYDWVGFAELAGYHYRTPSSGSSPQ